MAKTLGHRSHMELMAPEEGPKRKMRIVSFKGITGVDTGVGNGGVAHPQFDNAFQPIAVVDMTDGKLRTSEFSDTGDTLGTLTQVDTGPAGHTMWAIYTDTGV